MGAAGHAGYTLGVLSMLSVRLPLHRLAALKKHSAPLSRPSCDCDKCCEGSGAHLQRKGCAFRSESCPAQARQQEAPCWGWPAPPATAAAALFCGLVG